MSSPGKSERSKRYNSPSPFRVISPRRVNQERQPLIDRPLSEYEYGSILSNNNNKYPPHIPSHLINELLSKLGSASPSPLPLADAESIIYQAPDNNSSSSSRPYIVPTNVQRIDDLPWNELLPYYLPCLSWIGQYNLLFFVGDLIGGLTLVFFNYLYVYLMQLH